MENLENELANREREGIQQTEQGQHEIAQFLRRLKEFGQLMANHGCIPEALYTISFQREIRHGRPHGRWRSAESGVDEYIAQKVADVWFCNLAGRDWAGPDTGTAISTDGMLYRWTTDHKPVRSSTGGISGGGKTIEMVYRGLVPRKGQPAFLSDPAVLSGAPSPITTVPDSKRGGVDGLTDIAEFYLGRTPHRPSIYVQ